MNMMKKRGLLALSLFLLVSTVSFSQSQTGSITGVVLDEDKAPLPGVEIVISSPQLISARLVQTTNTKGYFRFAYLPPGTYTIKANLQGYEAIVQENVAIRLNIVTDVNIAMKPQRLEKEVVVTAAAPNVAIANAKLSTNVDFSELMKLPVSRSLNTYMTMAPGVLDGMVSLGGGRRENALNVDGIQMTDPGAGTGQGTQQSVEAYDEVQIETAGHAAEFGNVSGAVVNVVTKSGGNKIEGQFTLYYKNKGLLASNYGGTGLSAPDTQQLYNYDGNASVGGPIIKDKLWFYLSNGGIFYKNRIYGFSEDVPWSTVTSLGKITWQANAKNKLSLMLNYHYIYSPYDYASQFFEVQSTTKYTGKSISGVFDWMSTLDSDTYVEVRAAIVSKKNSDIGRSHDVEVYDYYTSMSSGGQGDFLQQRKRWQGQGSITKFVDDFVGTHQFKVGFEYEKGESKNRYLANEDEYGMGAYYTYDGEPYMSYQYVPTKGEWQIDSFNQYSGYIQDSWKPNRYLAANIGFRYNVADTFCPPQGGYEKITIAHWKNLEPRITVGIDPFGTGKTGFKLGYSRYSTLMYTWAYNLNPNIQGYNLYYNTSPGVFELIESYTPLSYTIDPDLKRPHTDEFLASVDHLIAKDWTVRASYVYRKTRDLITCEDIARTSDWYEAVETTNPLTGEALTIYNLKDGAPDPYYYYSNNPLAKKDYHGLIFELEKKLSHRYQFRLSYTWSRAKGSETQGTSSSGGGLLSIADDWANPNYLINRYGILDKDRTHDIKFQGIYFGPWDLVFSLSYWGMSGIAYTPYAYAYLNQGAESILLEALGSERLPFMHKIDIRAEKEIAIGDTKLSFFATVYNILNSNTVTSLYAYYGSSSYGSTLAVQTARTTELGFRFIF